MILSPAMYVLSISEIELSSAAYATMGSMMH